MPSKTKKAAAPAAKAAVPQIPKELLEQLIPGPVTPAQFEDIFLQFKKAFMERALGAEMTHHLEAVPQRHQKIEFLHLKLFVEFNRTRPLLTDMQVEAR